MMILYPYGTSGRSCADTKARNAKSSLKNTNKPLYLAISHKTDVLSTPGQSLVMTKKLKLETIFFLFAFPLMAFADEPSKTRVHWHEGTKLTFELPERWRISDIRKRSFRILHDNPEAEDEFQVEASTELRFEFHPYPPGQNRAKVSAEYVKGDARNAFKKIEIADNTGFVGSQTQKLSLQKGGKKLEMDIFEKVHVVPLKREILFVIFKCPVERWEDEKVGLSLVLSTLSFSGKHPKGAVLVAPARPNVIVIAKNDTPYSKKHILSEGDTLIYRLPNGKEIALWTEKDRFAFGEQVTKSGLQCWWGEKPFKFSPEKVIQNSDGSITRESTSYIEQGSVITSTRNKTTEHQLRVDEWDFSYIKDLSSHPKLDVTVIIKHNKGRQR